MIAVFTLIAYSFVQSGYKFPIDASLSLSYSLDTPLKLFRMIHLHPGGCGDKVFIAGVYAYAVLCRPWNRCRLRIYEQTEIPTGSSLDDSAALDLAVRDVLLVIANHAKARHFDLVICRCADRIRKGNAVEPITHTLEAGLLGDLLETTLP